MLRSELQFVDDYFNEEDEEEEEINVIPTLKNPMDSTVQFNMARDLSSLMQRCRFRKIFLRLYGSTEFLRQLLETMTISNELHVSYLYQDYLQTLFLDAFKIDLNQVLHLVTSHCPSLEKLHIMGRSFVTNSSLASITNIQPSNMKDLRIVFDGRGLVTESHFKTYATVFPQILEHYLPNVPNLTSIYLPVWSPEILSCIASHCSQIKELILCDGALLRGVYDECIDMICQNIKQLERFAILKSKTIGFSIDISYEFFAKLLAYYSDSLREFIVATTTSRFPHEIGREHSIVLPHNLEHLHIENIKDHFYNSSTPLLFIDLLSDIFKKPLPNTFLTRLSIDMDQFNMNFVECIPDHLTELTLNIQNSLEVVTSLSKRNTTSCIRKIGLGDLRGDTKTYIELLTSPYFSHLQDLHFIGAKSYESLAMVVQSLRGLKSVAVSKKFKNFNGLSDRNWINNILESRNPFVLISSDIVKPTMPSFSHIKEITIGVDLPSFLHLVYNAPNIKRLTIEVNGDGGVHNASDVLIRISQYLVKLEYLSVLLKGKFATTNFSSEKCQVLKFLRFGTFATLSELSTRETIELMSIAYYMCSCATFFDFPTQIYANNKERGKQSMSSIFNTILIEKTDTSELEKQTLSSTFSQEIIEKVVKLLDPMDGTEIVTTW